MKKKNRVLRIGLLALVLTLVTASLVSGTFAKYVTTVNGTGTVTVAKWNVAVNNDASTESNDYESSFNILNTATTNVTAGKVAPGTNGSFNLQYNTNGSEVAHKVKINLTAISLASDLPQLVLYKDSAFKTPIALSNTGTDIVSTDTIAEGGTTSPVTVTVYWRWEFENEVDLEDTTDGIAAEDYDVTATFTVTQVD